MRCSWIPPQNSPACFEVVGVANIGRYSTPGSWAARRSSMIASMWDSVMKGAPNQRKGVVVPRPSEMFSDSMSPVPA